ncbi:MAG: hypothetical protein CME62_16720 [Halobacteriovoraceae bacterium]|nr:hypothetical protein [Halobacteriovoraceae bacterium]|tara:strand:- start:3704 stop:4429 length:726 start_codon:yes stop_codon:yes gene_type:complete
MLPHFEFAGITVYTYPLILGVVWGLSYELSRFLIQIKSIKIPYFGLYFILVFLSSWLGAKILYLITLNHELIIQATGQSSFWLGGGFVFYGGAIFGIVATLCYAKLLGVKIREFSFAVPVLVLCHGLGRVACFMAGCCYGTPTDLFFAVSMHGTTRHPVQLYEAFALLSLGFYLLKRFQSNKPVLWVYLLSYSVIRFVLEYFRGDKIRGVDFFGLFSTSQLISLALFALAIGIILRSSRRL